MTRTQALAFGAVAAMIGLATYRYFNPPIDAGIRLIDRKADSHELKKIDQADPKLQKLVGGDDRQFGAALKDFGSEDGARRADRAAALARAKNEIPVIPEAAVPANESTWISIAPVFEPVHVTVPLGDHIIPYFRKTDETNADGIPFDSNRHKYDYTVLGEEQMRRHGQLIDQGRINQLIGRLCDASFTICGDAFPLGSDAVVCGRGYLQLAHNGLIVLDRLRTSLDFANGRGGFHFSIVPDNIATSTCRTNQGRESMVLSNPHSRGFHQ